MTLLSKLKRHYKRFLAQDAKNGNTISVSATSVVHAGSILSRAVIHGNVSIGEGAKIKNGVTIYARSFVSIGRYTSINGENTDILARINPVTIGNFCSIARNVSIQEYNHYTDRPSSYYMLQNIFGVKEGDICSKGPVTLGHDVWVGTQCVLLSGVTIGNGAIVAANSVVAGDIPPYAIVAGSPARVIKYRFPDEVIAGLQELAWWDWPLEKIQKNKAFFSAEVTLETLARIL